MNKHWMATASVCAALALGSVRPAFAQAAGDNVVSLGWFHVQTLDSSSNQTTTVPSSPIYSVLGLPTSFTSPGTSQTVSNANTLGLTIAHFLTDNIAVTTVAGVPPTFKLYGTGILQAPGPAGALGNVNLGSAANNPLVTSVREWSPALLLQYYLFDATSRFRPFAGLGVSYNWFSSIQLNQNFKNDLNTQLGATLAAGSGHPTPTSVYAQSSPSWQPVFNAGLTYNFNEHWSVVGSVSYIPLKTTTVITIKGADGAVLSQSKSELKVNPVISFVALGYKF
ncbi:MAG TPA: OmpW family outer membrane protein [Pararobbsia sp.]|jgi:outer membrane protein|nr:OmpW family outer membrane protein [Pararobbsia sp.]